MPHKPEILPLQVLHQEEGFLVLKKPQGLVCSQDFEEQNSIAYQLKALGHSHFPGLVHRIDTPASGLVLWAQNPRYLAELSRLFQQGLVTKTYWAIIPGGLTSEFGETGQWEDRLWHNQRSNKSFVQKNQERKGKVSRLEYRVLSQGDRFDLIEVNLLTGRTHQIRAQFAHRGYPLRGDLKYGARRSRKEGGIGLLARQIAFPHSQSGELFSLACPLPATGLWRALAPEF
jgi:23S rRNA pseudouridine1911/1915/1917 synthase